MGVFISPSPRGSVLSINTHNDTQNMRKTQIPGNSVLLGSRLLVQCSPKNQTSTTESPRSQTLDIVLSQKLDSWHHAPQKPESNYQILNFNYSARSETALLAQCSPRNQTLGTVLPTPSWAKPLPTLPLLSKCTLILMKLRRKRDVF